LKDTQNSTKLNKTFQEKSTSKNYWEKKDCRFTIKCFRCPKTKREQKNKRINKVNEKHKQSLGSTEWDKYEKENWSQ
jgi:hypothetical protein